MRVEYINPFISSLTNAFLTMLGCQVRRGAVSLKDGNSPKYEVSGVVGLSGRAIGTVVLSLSEAVALKATSTMLLCETTSVNADVVDAVGGHPHLCAFRHRVGPPGAGGGVCARAGRGRRVEVANRGQVLCPVCR